MGTRKEKVLGGGEGGGEKKKVLFHGCSLQAIKRARENLGRAGREKLLVC